VLGAIAMDRIESATGMDRIVRMEERNSNLV
jgi:hypothetical protein